MFDWRAIGAEYMFPIIDSTKFGYVEQEILYKWEIRRQIVHKRRLQSIQSVEDLPPIYDEELEKVLSKEPIYQTNRPIALVLLQQIERMNNPRHITSGMTIEHIMPQTLNGYWKGINTEEHTEHVHTLGNLTLTDYNSELSNKSFQEKKDIYKKEHLFLNDRVLELQTWNTKSIEARNRKLVKEAMDFLAVPVPKNRTEAKKEYTGADITEIPFEKPATVTIQGEELKAKSWRELYFLFVEYLIMAKPIAYMTMQSECPNYFAKYNEEGKILSTGDKLRVSLSKREILHRIQVVLSLSGIENNDFIMRYVDGSSM